MPEYRPESDLVQAARQLGVAVASYLDKQAGGSTEAALARQSELLKETKALRERQAELRLALVMSVKLDWKDLDANQRKLDRANAQLTDIKNGLMLHKTTTKPKDGVHPKQRVVERLIQQVAGLDRMIREIAQKSPMTGSYLWKTWEANTAACTTSLHELVDGIDDPDVQAQAEKLRGLIKMAEIAPTDPMVALFNQAVA